MNLARYCLTHAAPNPDKHALEVVGSGGVVLETWTYADLLSGVMAIAAGLNQTGLQPGDRLLLRIGHSSDFPLLFFGAIAAGMVPVPTSALLTSLEATAILIDSGARLVLHDGKTSLPDAKDCLVFGPDEVRSLKQANPNGIANTAPDDPAFLIYTSGTSGTPKGVLHAQRAAAARQPMYQGWYGISENDRLLHAGAFNWTYTLGVGLMDPWANGATSIVYDGPRDPEVWPIILERTRASLFAAVPSLYRRMLKYSDVSAHSFPTLRHGLTAGEALAASLYHDWKARTGRELYEALGMSEISTYLSSGPSVPVKPGSPGVPQKGRKITILDEQTEEIRQVDPNTPGALAVHRDEAGLMLGYWNRPQETKSAFKGDWFLTGDRARQDEDGYCWYEGRSDDLMNAFGYRVAPEEVERVLAAHDNVSEVAVSTVPTSTGVDLITAFVVPKNIETFDPSDLAKFAADRLAEYKRPKEFRLVKELPRTPSGKVQRKLLATS
ncbi:MAG: AMP-binding protein [Roseibium sp.]